jgi:HK97 family phage prohead protease
MPNTRKIKVGKQATRAQFRSETFNNESRTVEVTFATDKPVLRYSWDGPFYEVLDMAGHQTNRSKGSLPVLNNHDAYTGVNKIIGRAENIRLEDGVWVATVRFSKRDDVTPIMDDVKDGIIQDISVGYRVMKYEASPEAGEIPTYIARKWESNEISFVTVPADENSKVRGDEDESQAREITIDTTKTNINLKTDTMKRELIIAALVKRGIVVPETSTDAELMTLLERALENPTTTTTPAKTEGSNDAVLAERARVTEINDNVREFGLDNAVATRLIDGAFDVTTCRSEIIKEIAKRDALSNKGDQTQHRANITVGADQTDKTRVAMAEAIEHRVNPTIKLDTGRDFRGMSLMDMARFSLEATGVKTQGLSRRQIATMALNIGDQSRAHSSSDFPIILANTINRTLRRAYSEQERTFTPFCRRASAADFKALTRTQISALVGDFDKIPEGGEYKSATFTEGGETYKLAKYGKIINFTWEMLINDDLDAFGRLPQAMASRAANKQSDIVYSILLDNAAMGDNVALFHATHKNLGNASAINEAGMTAAHILFRKQKGLANEAINITPKFLIVGPDKEIEAMKLINGITVPGETADVNVFKGSRQIISDSRVTGNKWFLSADPSQIDTIEYAFLDGEEELFTESRTGFDVDGLQYKARMVFAAKAIDHRGLFYNPGA